MLDNGRIVRDNELIDYQGKLAMHLVTTTDWHRPITATHLLVSNIPVRDIQHNLTLWLGYTVYFPNGYTVGRIDNYRVVDVRGWERVSIETPIAPPRNGREYGWTWAGGRWIKEWFPRCSACYHYHDPSFIYCDNCGHCHRPGKRCKCTAQNTSTEETMP